MGNVVVTGSSTGIGRATVARLAGKGHTVFAGVRKQSDADALEAEVPGVVPLLADVTDAEQVAAAAKEVTNRVGAAGVHGLVNNAGIGIFGPMEYLDVDEFRRELEVNVTSHVAVTQTFLPLIRRATGRIVFTGSISGRMGLPLLGPYAASKHALEGLTESWRAELAPWGIKVVLVEPGSIATPIWAKARGDLDGVADALPAEGRERYAAFLDVVPRMIDRQIKVAIPPERVAKVMEKALFGKRPRARYLVGPDGHATGVVSRFLPDGAKAQVLGLASGARVPRGS